MKNIVLILTYFLICSPGAALADNAPAPGNKKAWALNITQTLPGLLCDSKKYFVTCFSVTQAECTEFTELLVKACLSNVQLALPQDIDSNQGEYWGKVIGKCSYDLYEKFMQNKKLPKPGCDDFHKPKDDLPQSSQDTP